MPNEYLKDLKNCHRLLREFLENFAQAAEPAKLEYWKSQISGTLITYPNRELEELHQNFYGESQQPTSRSKAIAAYWVLRLLSGENLSESEEEIEALYLALNTPGQIIPSNDRDEIIVGGNDVTLIAKALVKSNYLLFLVEHSKDIKEFVRTNQDEVDKEFGILRQFNSSWLKQQIQSVQEVSTSCFKFIPDNNGASSSNQVAASGNPIHSYPAGAIPDTAWGQFWHFCRLHPDAAMMPDADQLYQSPVINASFYKRAFFWVLYWSCFPSTWELLMDLCSSFKDALKRIKEYLFADSTSLRTFFLAREFLETLISLYAITLLYLILIGHGISSLPLNTFEVGMKYVGIPLQYQNYLAPPRLILSVSQICIFAFGLCFFYRMILSNFLMLALLKRCQSLLNLLATALSAALVTARMCVIASKLVVIISKLVIEVAKELYQYYSHRHENEQNDTSSHQIVTLRELNTEPQDQSRHHSLIFTPFRERREPRDDMNHDRATQRFVITAS